ncbi:MAG TPA: hypothetical protein PLB00_11400 [Pseudomonadota bacterium]|nr:hypothetical protein [Pseudomonadota bacterium]
MRILLMSICLGLSCAGAVRAQTVNGCSRASATNLSGQSTLTITFANGNFTYSPKCVKVDLGTQVTFSGTFVNHPLLGGTVTGGVATPASSGPFVPETNSGNSKAFTMTSDGDFPYYCTFHGAGLSMNGVVYAGPDPLPDDIFDNGFE